jgi:hypothetical protein
MKVLTRKDILNKHFSLIKNKTKRKRKLQNSIIEKKKKNEEKKEKRTRTYGT